MILETADKDNMRAAAGLYKRAFPPNERAPFSLIRKRAAQRRADMLIAKDSDGFTGFAYMVTYEDLVYLFYLAVDEKKRGRGNGSEIIRLLKNRYSGKRLFLAREQLDENAGNSDERIKRRGFYIRNGFEDWPVQIKEGGMVYDAMGIGKVITAREYDALIGNWSGKLLRRFVDMRVIEGTAAEK